MNSWLWYGANIGLLLNITYFAVWQINSRVFRALPKVLKVCWWLVIAGTLLVITESGFGLNITPFPQQSLECGIDFSTARTMALMLWMSFINTTYLIYHNKVTP